MESSFLASGDSSEDLSSTNNLAFLCSLPHVEGATSLASWSSLDGQAARKTVSDEFVDLDAVWFGHWWLWVLVDNLVVVVPFASIESPPLSSVVLEDVTLVMPETTVPFPGSTIAVLGWSVVMPFARPPSVPNTVVELPLD